MRPMQISKLPSMVTRAPHTIPAVIPYHLTIKVSPTELQQPDMATSQVDLQTCR